MSLPYALCKVSLLFFTKQSREAEIALRTISDPDDLLEVFLRYKLVRAAGRLIGAYRFCGLDETASYLNKKLHAVGFPLLETNPFISKSPLLRKQPSSPYAARITALWQQHRDSIIDLVPKAPGLPKSSSKFLKQIAMQTVQDAYHSLSIEGFRVTQELLDRVANKQWNPAQALEDSELTNTIAAAGYFKAFQRVQLSLTSILTGELPGQVVATDLHDWYEELFSPNVAAGLLSPVDLVGYRRHPVYIRQSRHTPLPAHALRDAMGALFDCLKSEPHPAVRAILGHFLFVYIHPFMDGNGRIGRFLMNTMLGSGGYPWTIIHVENRDRYMEALEAASAKDDIVPFATFICDEMRHASNS